MEYILRFKKRIVIAGIVISVASLSVFAEMFSPTSLCSKPYKPYEFNTQWELDSFNDDVDRYKSCISDFVEEQNEAAESHQQAANDAIEEWNSFVNYELN
jgi:hypothetical protein